MEEATRPVAFQIPGLRAGASWTPAAAEPQMGGHSNDQENRPAEPSSDRRIGAKTHCFTQPPRQVVCCTAAVNRDSA